MPLPVVFISHSSKDSAEVALLVKALERRGTLKTTFDVRDLRDGQEYAPQLHRWLALCQGGVLVLTPQVMANAPWVLQEATVLRSRYVQEGADFRLFVVIEASVLTSTVWQQWFAPLKLDTLQRVKFNAADDPVKTRLRVVRAVLRGLHDLKVHDTGLFGLLTLKIASRLKAVLLQDDARRELEDAYSQDDAEWERIVLRQPQLSEHLAGRLCNGEWGAYGAIHAMFQALQTLCDAPARRALLGVLRSYWIPLANASALADAVQQLAPAAAPSAPPNLLLLQTEAKDPREVVAMYVERQFMPYNRTGTLLHLPSGGAGLSALRSELRRELAARVLPQEAEVPGTDAAAVAAQNQRIVERLREDLQLDSPLPAARRRPTYFFVHIPNAATLKHVLPVAREYWPCVFIVSAAPAVCDEMAGQLLHPVLKLPPQAGAESTHLNHIDRALAFCAH